MTNSSGRVSMKDEVQELFATNYIGLAGYTILLYDHLLTLDDEIKFVWRGSKRLVIWLFLINRYLTPLAFAVNINAYTSHAWSDFTCTHFVVYEGIMGFVGVAIASLMMAFRVAAVYQGNRFVLGLISVIFLVMVGINTWLLTTTGPVIHPGIHGCSMLFGQAGHNIGGWVSATAWTPLIYDTTVIVLIVLRTQYIIRAKVAGKVVAVLIRDGLLYFSVIVVVNLVLAVMIVKAPVHLPPGAMFILVFNLLLIPQDGIKNICAQLQLLMTVTMMSRITLSLRKNMHGPIAANSAFSAFGDTYLDVELQDLKAPKHTTRRFPDPERLQRYTYT